MRLRICELNQGMLDTLVNQGMLDTLVNQGMLDTLVNQGMLDTLVKRGRWPVTEPRKQSINFGAKNREAGGHKRVSEL